ncbi:MAG TPA: glycosyltransferase family A protein [Flavobacterium sp.]|uniref:glycosyltransferase family 2 protein n=1 Tax=Flavobacterium sp. TaxID=239 RepID=UPI002CBE4561|nr:glycosyltransferase family A protein [Flavobacterium sp.]HSD14563.1 glycosyltransferase family A protein [Flavobacterium sp.]
MPLISVIIPLYNKDFSIGRTLESVLRQTFTDFEIIIVNDGSTDKSVEKVLEFSDSRIHLFHQKNEGAASARNSGISKASGSLIAFLDGDDVWFENHMEKLAKLYTDFPDCGLYCSRYLMKISKNNIIAISYKDSVQDNYRGILPDYFASSMKFRVGLTSALAIPKTILNTDMLFNPEVSSGQDLELFTKIAIKHHVAITGTYTLEYNFSLENQLSKTPITRKKLMDFSQFSEAEKNNKSLKNFLDLYRVEYALHYHMFGDTHKSQFYLKEVDKENIGFKTRLLFHLPGLFLRTLLKIKRVLNKVGINFTVYH